MQKITVGTRRSALAKTQMLQVVEALQAANPGLQIDLREVVTKGDQIQDRALSEVGGKGLFVSEIEALLQEGVIDFAVHSMKDVPAELATGLVIGCVPERADARDLLISRNGYHLHSLPSGARLGTSSLRRSAMVLEHHPHIIVESLRGNIDTRLRKLASLDAIILATAGVARMGWWDGAQVVIGDQVYHASPLPVLEFLPAVGQGALALECREDDANVLRILRTLHDPHTAAATGAERAFLATVGGSCQVPVAAHAQITHDAGGTIQMMVQGFIGLPDGSRILREELRGIPADELGEQLGKSMLERGGQAILDMLAGGQAGWK